MMMAKNPILIESINDSSNQYHLSISEEINKMDNVEECSTEFKKTYNKLKGIFPLIKSTIEKRTSIRERCLDFNNENNFNEHIKSIEFYQNNNSVINDYNTNNQNIFNKNLPIQPSINFISNNSAINKEINNNALNGVINNNNNSITNALNKGNNISSNIPGIPLQQHNNIKIFYENNEMAIVGYSNLFSQKDYKQFNFNKFIKKQKIKNFLRDNTHLRCDEIIDLIITFVDEKHFHTNKFYDHLKSHNDHYAIAYKKNCEKRDDQFFLLSFQNSSKSRWGELSIQECSGSGDSIYTFLQELEREICNPEIIT